MARLFEAARQGDRDAESEIHRIIREFARRMCRGGSPAGAADLDWEDVAQEAGRRFFSRAIDQFKEPGSERGYLYVVVKSTTIQFARSVQRRRKRESPPSIEHLVVSDNPGPRLDAIRILTRLSESCRDLLVQVYLVGAPYSELAESLGLVESSVRSKVSRCVRKARELAEGAQ